MIQFAGEIAVNVLCANRPISLALLQQRPNSADLFGTLSLSLKPVVSKRTFSVASS